MLEELLFSYTFRVNVLKSIMQFELCSKYDREQNFDVVSFRKPRWICRLRLVALYKSLTIIATSFLNSKCNRTYVLMGIKVMVPDFGD